MKKARPPGYWKNKKREQRKDKVKYLEELKRKREHAAAMGKVSSEQTKRQRIAKAEKDKKRYQDRKLKKQQEREN